VRMLGYGIDSKLDALQISVCSADLTQDISGPIYTGVGG